MLKIQSGIYKNRKIKKPKSARAIQRGLRQHIFDYLKEFINNANVLDLFAGAGTFGIEALSHGAKHVTFVEKNKAAIKTIEHNIHALGLEDMASIIKADVLTFLNKNSRLKSTRFNIIFIDPPFKMILNYTPERQKRYIRSLLFRSYKLLRPRSTIILKLHKNIPLSLMQNMGVLDIYKYGINVLYYLVQPQYINKQNLKELKLLNNNKKFTTINEQKKHKYYGAKTKYLNETQIYKILEDNN